MPGTRVFTEEAGLQPLLWVGSTMLVPGANGQRPEMTRLTRISADAFGPGRPMPDLMLGAGARVLSKGRSVAAAELADGVQVVRVAPVTPVRLYHVLLPRHARLRVNGLPVESYHPGTLTENSLPRELLELFAGPVSRDERALRLRPAGLPPGRARSAGASRRRGRRSLTGDGRHRAGQAERPSLSSRTSKGTPGSSFAQRITSDVLTLATLSAAVSSPGQEALKRREIGRDAFEDEIDLAVQHVALAHERPGPAPGLEIPKDRPRPASRGRPWRRPAPRSRGHAGRYRRGIRGCNPPLPASGPAAGRAARKSRPAGRARHSSCGRRPATPKGSSCRSDRASSLASRPLLAFA